MDSIKVSITPPRSGSSLSSTAKAVALPQRPGPNGSRVMKKRFSNPRLGDGFGAIFTRMDALAKSPTTPTVEQSDVLGRPATSSVDSDDELESESSDDVALDSNARCSVSRASSLSKSKIPGGGRATLTESPSPVCSDQISHDAHSTISAGKTHPPSSNLTPCKASASHGPDEVRSHTARPDDLVSSTALADASILSTPQSYAVPDLTDGQSAPSSNASPNTPGSEPIAIHDTSLNSGSLHDIVRSFFALKPTSHPEAVMPTGAVLPSSNAPNPYWTAEKILSYVLDGKITVQNAKATARRHGYKVTEEVLECYVADAVGNDLPYHASESASKASAPGAPASVNQAPCQYPVQNCRHPRDSHRCDLAYETFVSKLVKHRSQDISGGVVRPLHIFVDISNIHIGFCDSWKISQNIPLRKGIRTRAPAFNFNVLTSIMERNRPISTKFLAGSVAMTASPSRWPRYFADAHHQGYKMHIFTRVPKTAQDPGDPSQFDLMTSGDESTGGQPGSPFQIKNGEQGVDENLHLHMTTSMLDHMKEPATMVVATGDAAKAQYSTGFFVYIMHALSLGWNIELVTWKKTVSSAYTNPTFQQQHGGRFRIIYLDDFLQELNAGLCTGYYETVSRLR
ncbi:hypothetical protein F5Y16DRAFT_172472 [Xylariaceae sp. FL0255]|nr:hypothetical protein F5Y16DRAFT_172472 [Xylariaceae sp. FL0255]